jgi:predicted Mrr-cat superfamily restriction endonuclease
MGLCSPQFFEHIVVKLLRAMGYGGQFGEGRVTNYSHDGGIDGVINEDKLGLDVVCVQAKRWQGTVSRPTIQSFVGSMDMIVSELSAQGLMDRIGWIRGEWHSRKDNLLLANLLGHTHVQHRSKSSALGRDVCGASTLDFAALEKR